MSTPIVTVSVAVPSEIVRSEQIPVNCEPSPIKQEPVTTPDAVTVVPVKVPTSKSPKVNDASAVLIVPVGSGSYSSTSLNLLSETSK